MAKEDPVPTALTGLPPRVDPPRKRWTRAECERLFAAEPGAERLELVEGELISKMGKKGPHVSALILLQAWLVQVFGVRFVRPEAPIDVAPEDNPTSEPEPDLAVTSRDLSHFLAAHPQPTDLRLVVEIADTTLSFDLTVKARLYARAGIVEYWVLDVTGRQLIVHRSPHAGVYRSVERYEEHEPVAPLAASEAWLLVRDVLPA